MDGITKSCRIVFPVCLLLFVLAVLLKLNGWSMGMWHRVIDHTEPKEIFLFHERALRSDDWLLDLPLNLAQEAAVPAFPAVNPNIGEGQNVLAPLDVPTRNGVTWFRPFSWGFWLGPDYGLAWRWWGMTLALFCSFYWALLWVTRGNPLISGLTSFMLVYSPYFQFWSLHKAEIAIHWACSFAVIAHILFTRKPKVIWLGSLFLGWSLAGMVLEYIYPPILIPVASLLPFAVVGLIWDRWDEFRVVPEKKSRWIAIGVGCVLAAAAVGKLFWDDHEVITLIQNTVYPGKRFSPGGGFPPWAFFANNFFPEVLRKGPWIGNTCEDGSFLFAFPLIIFLFAAQFVREKQWRERWSLCFFPILAFIGIYTYIGLPPWLARLTFYGMSTVNRTQMAFGIADAFIVASGLSILSRASFPQKTRWFAVLAWTAFLVAWGYWFRHEWDLKLPIKLIWGVAAFYGLIAYAGVVRGFVRVFLLGLTLASFAYSIGFNPWTRGGAQYIYENPISKKILELNHAENGEVRWLAYGDITMGQLLPMLGVKSLGGYLGHPHLKQWAVFDPSRKYMSVYNQCSFVIFEPSKSLDPTFEAVLPGVLRVKVNPLADALSKLDVRFFLVAGTEDIKALDTEPRLQKIYQLADRAIYRKVP